MLGRGPVKSLEESFREVGLDPDKAIAEINDTSDMIQRRTHGNFGGGAPSYTRSQRPATETDDGGGGGGDGGTDLDEAARAVKKKHKTAGERAMEKRSRKKGRPAAKLRGRIFRQKHKKQIAKRQKMKLKKFGGAAGLAKLHKAGKRITFSEPDSSLASLREDLNGIGSAGVDEDRHNSYEEAAYHCGLLSLYLGEMFEAFGDQDSADTMYDVSDKAADLSEALDSFDSEDEMDEDQEARFGSIIERVIKALQMYEAMGAPSLVQIIEFAEERDGKDDSEAA